MRSAVLFMWPLTGLAAREESAQHHHHHHRHTLSAGSTLPSAGRHISAAEQITSSRLKWRPRTAALVAVCVSCGAAAAALLLGVLGALFKACRRPATKQDTSLVEPASPDVLGPGQGPPAQPGTVADPQPLSPPHFKPAASKPYPGGPSSACSSQLSPSAAGTSTLAGGRPQLTPVTSGMSQVPSSLLNSAALTVTMTMTITGSAPGSGPSTAVLLSSSASGEPRAAQAVQAGRAAQAVHAAHAAVVVQSRGASETGAVMHDAVAVAAAEAEEVLQQQEESSRLSAAAASPSPCPASMAAVTQPPFPFLPTHAGNQHPAAAGTSPTEKHQPATGSALMPAGLRAAWARIATSQQQQQQPGHGNNGCKPVLPATTGGISEAWESGTGPTGALKRVVAGRVCGSQGAVSDTGVRRGNMDHSRAGPGCALHSLNMMHVHQACGSTVDAGVVSTLQQHQRQAGAGEEADTVGGLVCPLPRRASGASSPSCDRSLIPFISPGLQLGSGLARSTSDAQVLSCNDQVQSLFMRASRQLQQRLQESQGGGHDTSLPESRWGSRELGMPWQGMRGMANIVSHAYLLLEHVP